MRTRAPLEEVAGDIRAAGGSAETTEVDALNEHAVDAPRQRPGSGDGSAS
jgi:3-oxoacyl-[acyl-carrier protein] reductase